MTLLKDLVTKKDMQRTRLWVNFSKEYSKEYEKSVKEKNFSNLVCRLLRDYYNNYEEDDDINHKINEIYSIIKNIPINNIEINNNIEEDDYNNNFSIW